MAQLLHKASENLSILPCKLLLPLSEALFALADEVSDKYVFCIVLLVSRVVKHEIEVGEGLNQAKNGRSRLVSPLRFENRPKLVRCLFGLFGRLDDLMDLVAQLCLEYLLAIVGKTLQSRAEQSRSEANSAEILLFLRQPRITIELVNIHDLPTVFIHVRHQVLRDLIQLRAQLPFQLINASDQRGNHIQRLDQACVRQVCRRGEHDSKSRVTF